MKPFVTYHIDRDGVLHREVLSSYETLGRGATASARREMKKFIAQAA